MSIRMHISLSDELNEKLGEFAAQQGTTKGEILRKALQLYLAARAGTERGLKVGLVNTETNAIETEIIGL